MLNEKAIWLAVVRDLAALSPDAALSRHAHKKSAIELRDLARGFLKTHRWLSSGYREDVSTIEIDFSTMPLVHKLAHRGLYIVSLLAMGHVQLFSSKNGKMIDEFIRIPYVDFSTATMTVCESTLYGPMVVIIGDEESE
jgi:hypothetical protein